MFPTKRMVIFGVALVMIASVGMGADRSVVLQDRPDPAAVRVAGGGAMVLDAASFSGDPGSWSVSGYPGALTGTVLQGLTNGRRAEAVAAVREVEVEKAGLYRVWVRTWDSAHDNPGSRFFDVNLGDGLYQKRFGNQGRTGFGWEDGGTVELPVGPLRVSLMDTSAHYARFDALYLTDQIDKEPPQLVEHLHMAASPEPPEVSEVDLPMPAWAKPEAADEVALIASERVRVRFLQNTGTTRRPIRPIVEVRREDEWVVMTDPSQPYGHLVVFADECRTGADYSFASTFYEANVETADGSKVSVSPSIFQLGINEWLVPDAWEQVGAAAVRLRARGELADLVIEWRVLDGLADPKVTCTLLPRRDGVFSVGSFHGPARNLGSVDYLLCGKIYLGLFAPPIACLVRESVSPNQMNLMTTALDPAAGLGTEATYGLIVDPESAPFRWAKADTSLFGFGLRSPDGRIQPMVFAPLPDSPEARMVAGTPREFSYRPVSRLGGWFETYGDLARSVLRVRDQKSNYDVSLTDTIFNLQDLVMSGWETSGWHDKAMAFAYVETSKNSGGFNHSSPLTILQNYLLTEDANWLEKRAIPTLAFMISRPGAWISLAVHAPDREPPRLTGPRGAYPASIYQGLYQMTGGRVSAFQKVGLDGPLHPWTPVKGAKLEFLEKINRYRVTGEESLLADARAGADAYIETSVTPPASGMIAGVGFEIMTTAPWVPALLTMYEVTGDKKYLTAAHVAASKLLAHGTWVAPAVPDGTMTIRAEDLNARGLLRDENRVGSSNAGWNGFTRRVLGYEFLADWNANRVPMRRVPEAWERFVDVTAPAWVFSRVGLNVEHATQLAFNMGWDSPNIMMNCYAPDFLRIAAYTGDDLFATVARHETIARSANYPGYYLNNMMNIHRAADYPYVGPDVSIIEFTHIPAYLAKLQDFLFTQAWMLSGHRIEFPWIRQYAYAYFDNKVYGFAPGRFFDLEGIWPWLRRGLVSVDNHEIDWLAGRKDGVFVVATINQSAADITATVTLGEPMAGALPAVATIFAADGRRSELPISGGTIRLTVPARGLVGIAVESNAVKSPAFATPPPTGGPDLTFAAANGSDDLGTGCALQIGPGAWFAYSFLENVPDELASATLYYRIGTGPWQQSVIDEYPFEQIVRIADDSVDFAFRWEATHPDGSITRGTEKRIAAPGYNPPTSPTAGK